MVIGVGVWRVLAGALPPASQHNLSDSKLRERVVAWLEGNKIKYRHDDFEISIGRSEGPLFGTPTGVRAVPDVPVVHIRTTLSPQHANNLTWDLNRFFCMALRLAG